MDQSNNSPDDSSRPAITGNPGKYPGFPDRSLSTRFPKLWLRGISENASDISSSWNSTENCCGDTAEELPPFGPGGMSVRTTAAVTAVKLPSPSWIICWGEGIRGGCARNKGYSMKGQSNADGTSEGCNYENEDGCSARSFGTNGGYQSSEACVAPVTCNTSMPNRASGQNLCGDTRKVPPWIPTGRKDTHSRCNR